MDLLLPDIDLVISMINSDIKILRHIGHIDRTNPDVINTRIEFNNKCVAPFNAGKIALQRKRFYILFKPQLHHPRHFKQ
jgi:hypothetical protein